LLRCFSFVVARVLFVVTPRNKFGTRAVVARVCFRLFGQRKSARNALTLFLVLHFQKHTPRVCVFFVDALLRNNCCFVVSPTFFLALSLSLL
jgi:hypothetical protein